MSNKFNDVKSNSSSGKYTNYHFSMKGLENTDPNEIRFKKVEDYIKTDVVLGKRLARAGKSLLFTIACYILYRVFPHLVSDPNLGGLLSSTSLIVGSLSTIVTGAKYSKAYQMPVTTDEVIKYKDEIEERVRKNMSRGGHKKK